MFDQGLKYNSVFFGKLVLIKVAKLRIKATNYHSIITKRFIILN